MKFDPKDVERRKTIYHEWKTSGIPIYLPCPDCNGKIMRAHPDEKILVCPFCGRKMAYPKEA